MECVPNMSLFHQFPKFNMVYAKWRDEPLPSINTGRLEEDFMTRFINRNNWMDETIEGRREITRLVPDT